MSKEMSPHAKKSISVTIPLHFSPVKKHLVAWINFSRNDELIFTFLFIEFQTKAKLAKLIFFFFFFLKKKKEKKINM